MDRYLRRDLRPPTSAQSVADALSPIGTYIEEMSGEKIWVGLPLLEHRRCDNPMFELANKIAYGGMMKHCVSGRSEYPLSLSSTWIQVKGSCASGHWVPEQGQVIIKLLKQIYSEIVKPDLFIITPFRSVRDEISKQLKQLHKELSPESFISESSHLSFGTVHTFQGKEADIVILVLGCDHKKIGAADWAGERPNLLNVALTRARRRLFVIGDRNVWHGRGYFSTLVHEMDWIPEKSLIW